MLIPEYMAARKIKKTEFAKEMKVSVQAIDKWIRNGWFVVGSDLVSPKRKVKEL